MGDDKNILDRILDCGEGDAHAQRTRPDEAEVIAIEGPKAGGRAGIEDRHGSRISSLHHGANLSWESYFDSSYQAESARADPKQGVEVANVEPRSRECDDPLRSKPEPELRNGGEHRGDIGVEATEQ